MKKNIICTIVLFTFTLLSCEGDKEAGIDEILEIQKEEEEKKLSKSEQIDKIIYNIPSPTETVSILKRAGATYVYDYPNDPLNAEEYQTLTKQSLNLGIYGADLTYASVFNKSTETTFYLSCITKIGRKLGVEQVFNEDVHERVQDNIDNRDSMQTIVNETFWELDAYLKEQRRDNVSSLIVAGGWIESLYLASQFSKANPDNAEMRQRIAEQKYSLNNLMGLIKSYENKSGLSDVISYLEDLEESFDKIKENKKSNTASDEDGSMMIGNVITLDVSDDLISEITKKIELIRAEIIS